MLRRTPANPELAERTMICRPPRVLVSTCGGFEVTAAWCVQAGDVKVFKGAGKKKGRASGSVDSDSDSDSFDSDYGGAGSSDLDILKLCVTPALGTWIELERDVHIIRYDPCPLISLAAPT